MQSKGDPQNRRSTKYFGYAKQGFYLIVSPFVWLYRLSPIEKFTAALLIVSGLQATAFMVSERAFIFPDRIEFADNLASTETSPYILLYVSLKNSGKNYARIVSMSAEVTHGPIQADPVYGPGKNEHQFGFPPVPAGATIRQRLNFNRWPNQTMIDVRTGARQFYLFGKIEYADAFSWILRNKKSRFCFIYLPNVTDPGKGEFGNCPNPKYTGIE